MSDEQIVYVIDDEPSVLKSLGWLLESAGLTVRTFGSAETFLAECTAEARGCLLLDIRMPGMSGMSLIEELAERRIELPTILISAHADVPLTVRAMKAGVIDVLEKPFNDETLLERVTEALAREREQRSKRLRDADTARRIASLTPRERDVFELVVQGMTSKQIAAQLGINPSTVDVHRSHVMEKLGVSTSAQLVRVAMLHSQD
ncbi:MAG: response regulator transcription factor [Phycisphaerales bacterium JB038]